MMSQKDYYNILGITKNATADVIKKAYRKLAHKHHPDKAGNTPEVNEKFQEISEAYETLSNPDKRSAYDNPFTGSKQNWNWQNTNPFQTGDFSSFFTGRSTTKETMINRGRNLNAYVSITLEEMMTGATTPKHGRLNDGFALPTAIVAPWRNTARTPSRADLKGVFLRVAPEPE